MSNKNDLLFWIFEFLKVLASVIICLGIHSSPILLDPNFLFRQRTLRASSEQLNNMHCPKQFADTNTYVLYSDYQKDKIAKKMRMLLNNFKTKYFCTQTEMPTVSWKGPFQPAW